MGDVVTMMSHSRAYIRKKSVICMYKLYTKYPAGLRMTFDSLKEKLDDTDSSVVSCAVNVICELARKNPRNYLSMAPKFFKLLTTSSNNWMLIKVVKLMGSLVAEEPRLARKLLEPLSTIIQNTNAKSLQYECIHTITLALPFTKRDDGSEAKNVPAVLNLCTQQLRSLVQDDDQNLKYLGLVGLLQLMQSYPRVVVEQRELILKCLDDDDITIRTKALELLVGIVTKKSLVEFVHHLLRVRDSKRCYHYYLFISSYFPCFYVFFRPLPPSCPVPSFLVIVCCVVVYPPISISGSQRENIAMS
jgi:AP-3 complex subunit delta